MTGRHGGADVMGGRPWKNTAVYERGGEGTSLPAPALRAWPPDLGGDAVLLFDPSWWHLASILRNTAPVGDQIPSREVLWHDPTVPCTVVL